MEFRAIGELSGHICLRALPQAIDPGTWLRTRTFVFFLRDLGLWDYVGIDGNPLFIEFNPHLSAYAEHFQMLNLQEPIQLQGVSAPVQFDMVCSFEVLEHIREDAV